MSGTTNRIPSRVSRFALLGGGTVVAYTYLEEYIVPFIPLIVTIIGSLIAGFLVRHIFILLVNKKLISSYRYTNTQTQSRQKRVNNTQSRATSRERPINAPTDSLSLYRNLLGLGPQFTDGELKAAYRNAAAMYHPDRYASATRKERETAEDLMKKVNEAYECLKIAAV